jgi:NAD(P)-dependent dehydrogenase (short-subunit alcohol dehydrogenase family)
MPTSKRAVVTGGANGIGQAFSKRLAAQGAKVVVADIADDAETVGAIKKTGGSAIAVRCDQTSEADVNKLRDAVERELGAATSSCTAPAFIRPPRSMRSPSTNGARCCRSTWIRFFCW